jgi:hypothetical protein
MSQKYNGVSQKIDGFISSAVKVEAEQGKLLVTPDPKMIKIMEEGDFYNIVIVAPVLKHYFSTNLENIKIDADNVYCQIEVPEMFFTKEVRIVCKSGRPVEFRISNDPVTNPASQFVPQIVVVDDGAESTLAQMEQEEATGHEGLEDNGEACDEGDAD